MPPSASNTLRIEAHADCSCTYVLTAKQIAQQTAQRAAFLVDQAIQEKQSIIVRAQGEAKSAELIGEAVKANKGFLSLRRLEAAVRAVVVVCARWLRRVWLIVSIPVPSHLLARHRQHCQQERQPGHARLELAPARWCVPCARPACVSRLNTDRRSATHPPCAVADKPQDAGKR